MYWIFRGHSDSKLPLLTSLDRAIARFSSQWSSKREKDVTFYRDVLGKGLLDESEETSADPFERRPMVPVLEDGLLRRFQRQCHHYMIDTPDENDTLEWLALMRHYGAPSRLLDWTYSFFVAVYFALVDAQKEGAVWAIDCSWIRSRVKQILGEEEWKK
ncbi:MAG: FRG domain-containing protein, partial [Chloroflexota bacterium]